MYGRRHRHGGQGQFQSHSNTRTEFKNIRIFEGPSISKTDAKDSSFRIEMHPLTVSSSIKKLPIGEIKISPEKITEIEKLLQNLKPIPNVPYEEMKNSQFKHNFLEKRLGDMNQKMDFFKEEMVRQTSIDHELFIENNSKMEDEEYMRMYEKRKKLPSFQKRNRIIQLIEKNQVVLLSGDTGCGKTTQVPQFILDEYINGYKGSVCKIICTQPRRISAISVAERVAAERAEPLGISCGYQIRMEKVIPRKFGSILFVTNGIIIRHMESDPTLNNISHLILDEIHERDIHSDFLLALVKQLITKRKDLKVILMSATLNEKRFQNFFDFCPHVVIDGLAHPVEEYFLEDVVQRLNYSYPSSRQQESNQQNSSKFLEKVVPYVDQLERDGSYPSLVCREIRKPWSEEMNLDLIFKLTIDICNEEDEGAILIFVTGYDDINKLYNRFCETFTEDECVLVTLHSQIPTEEQRLVFDDPPPGVRKIIISTNIAETSITIDDVVYVIDSGWAKIKTYDARQKTENLESRFISRANSVQRKGRAGRLRPGKCFRLYTKARFLNMYEYQKPEILRTRLESIILQVKLLQLGLVRRFFEKLLDQPYSYIVDSSLNLLCNLGALDDEEALTPLGYYLAKLPINPQLGKMLLFGVFFSCLDPILNIAVGLDQKSPFTLNMKDRGQSQLKVREFSEGIQSDHLLLHKAQALYQKIEKSSRADFCKQFNLNQEVMLTLKNMKKEFMENLLSLQLVTNNKSTSKELNLHSTNIELIKSIVCAGLYPNIIVAFPLTPRTLFQTMDGHKVLLHKKSILFGNTFFSCPLLAYYIKMKTKNDMVHDATVCSPFSIIFFGHKLRIESGLHTNFIVADDIRFTCERNVSTVIESLRDRLEAYLLYRMMNPGSLDLIMDPGELHF
ncbi:hypothetical protein HHI36_015452 [Cryptolaemus montrouzieri]|uniref:RNA helicase n=1 Tax=Cryptolaemus montrouzieri TaxID=559131 RepID=A0ABD2N5N4_9CUCU